MAKSVLDQAQIILDGFNQSFKPADEFFEVDDIARQVVDERDGLLEEEFNMLWAAQQNKKNSDLDFIRINPDWISKTTAKIEQDKETRQWFATICEPLFEFPKDNYGIAVQEVHPFGSACSEFIRIATNQHWQVCMTPTNSMVFYSVEKCRIVLHNFNGYCTDKLDLRIVQSQSALPLEEQTVPDGKAARVRELVLSRMIRNWAAKAGKIDMTVGDQNPNPSPNESGKIYPQLKTQ